MPRSSPGGPTGFPRTGRIPSGGVVDAQSSHVDRLPTLCELAGTEPPADRTIDGKSLVPLLILGGGASQHRYIDPTRDRYFPNPDRRWGISDDCWKRIGRGTDGRTKHLARVRDSVSTRLG